MKKKEATKRTEVVGNKKNKGKLVEILNRNWAIMLYLYLVLPALLFLIAFIFKNNSFGHQIALLLHNYNLFIISPISGEGNILVGILGKVIIIGFLVYSIYKKDWTSLVLCSVFAILVILFFNFELNYTLIKYLNFAKP